MRALEWAEYHKHKDIIELLRQYIGKQHLPKKHK